MYEESKYAHGLLMYGYGRLPYITTTQTDVATDDASTNQAGVNGTYYTMTTGTWASDRNPMTQWDACKDGIQYVNLFLTKVKDVKWSPSSKTKNKMFVDRLTGEAHGLRALFYYTLLQAHGGYADDGILYGVPLLTEPEDASSDFNQSRATFADCVQQCFDDCDEAAELLPSDYVDIKSNAEIPKKYLKPQVEEDAEITGYNLVFGGKARNLMSRKIAKTIKAQVALLAASPAFRDQSGVTSAQAAEIIADAIKEIGGLDKFDKTGNLWYKNKTMLEPSAGEMDEIIWREDRHNNTDQENENFPPTLYGRGTVNPSQNLVDAFPMRNGLPITNPASGYNPKNPYANRDPRLAETVIYNGMTYRRTVIVTGTYPSDKNETDDNLNSTKNSTRTGYYLKKLLRDDVSPSTSGSEIKQQHIYPRIRLTEILLAFAEAANDAWDPKDERLGAGMSAYNIIKLIRNRAGLGTNEVGMPLPEGDAYLEECASDKAKMAQLIQNERRIELCFENKRFWDLRRWLLPLNEGIRGMKIDRDDETNELTYTVFNVEDRVFDNSYQCYGPIPKGEVLKWSNLKQNKGWK